MAKNIEEHLKEAEGSFAKAKDYGKSITEGKLAYTHSKCNSLLAQYHLSVALYKQNLALIELLKKNK